MNPELRFSLTPEAASKLDEILATNKMRFVRLTREQFDILAPDHPQCLNTRPYAGVHGLLEFDGREFPCTLNTFHQGQSLVLTPNDLEEKRCNDLVKILERAFPQPERGLLKRRRAEPEVDKGSIAGSIGCILVLLMGCGVLFLAVLGALSLFR
jgi:hypothetical protein